MTTTDNDNTLDKVLDVMESGGTVGKDAVIDDDVLAACRDLTDVAMLLDAAPTDVDSRLKAFHARHHRRAIVRTMVAVAAAAACIAALVMVTFTGHSGADLNSSPIAYTAVRNLKGVTIVGQNGKEIIKPTTDAAGRKVFNVLSASESDVVLTAAVPAGSSYEMQLSDGTRVYMHSNSRLVFPSRFTGTREVRLDGEAYFDVAHDEEHPFIVHGGNMQTEVLGTEFYVKAYGNASDNVTLVRGKVKVSSGNGSAVLSPGYQTLLSADGKLTTRSIDVAPYEYWRDGYLFYDHTTLKKIIESVAKDNDYGVEFMADETVDKTLAREMHFVADRTQGVASVLQALSELSNLDICVNGERVIVRKI